MLGSFGRRALRSSSRWLATMVAASVAGSAFAAPAREAPERAADPQDKMICKRFIETGSLVKGYRECKSKREWARERLNIRTSTLMSGGCNSAESGNCLGSTTIAGTTTPVPN
jgi:hypothetical protein